MRPAYSLDSSSSLMIKTPVRCRFDHLVVCANTCEQGVAWVNELSGVSMPFGGKHPLMATHNHLSALSDNSFFEVIATDPSAPPSPDHPRWFALDNPEHQANMDKNPVLTTWVVATSDLDSALEAARLAGVDAGVPVELTRGNLSWRLGLRDDGSLACGGVFPILIEWPPNVNPVHQMTDQGMRLDQLTLTHPDPVFLHQALQAIGAADLVTVSTGSTALNAQLHVANHIFHLNTEY